MYSNLVVTFLVFSSSAYLVNNTIQFNTILNDVPTQCNPREEWSDCGSACILTCDNMNQTSWVCTDQCIRGCFCWTGYVRNAQGDCVAPHDCLATTCKAHETWMDCGTMCPLTCDNMHQPPEACAGLCRSDCFCLPGYVRNSQGDCVLPEECTRKCKGTNEIWSQCGTSCPVTCDNYNNPPEMCNDRCNIGCFCKDGFIRNGNGNGECVQPTNCSTKCEGANEIWSKCGTSCPVTCDNYSNPPQMCNAMCYIGCVCDDGFIRNENGQCVHPTHCYSSRQ